MEERDDMIEERRGEKSYWYPLRKGEEEGKGRGERGEIEEHSHTLPLCSSPPAVQEATRKRERNRWEEEGEKTPL